MPPTTFTIHPTDDPDPMYAIMPSDDGPGYLVGEFAEVVNLRDTLNCLIEQAEHDGEISHLDERLGWAWLTVQQASEQYNIPERTVLYAASHGHIQAARKQNGQWRFPSATFRGWMVNRPRPGPKPVHLR